MKGIVSGFILAASMVAGTSAQAAPCWSDAAYEAAQLRDLDTLLMVQTLRCRIKDIDFSADYNRFVREKRPLLSAANVQLQNQFALTVGKARAIGAYDDFMTKIANGYGGGTKNMNCSDYAALAREAASAPVSQPALIRLADRAGAKPPVPGSRCGTTVALNERK